MRNGRFVVLGKGNKLRKCYFGQATEKVLLRHLRGVSLDSDAPLFLGTRGTKARRAFTCSGLLQLLLRLGKVVGVEVTVHQIRRKFTTTILQNGSNVVAVRDMLGHSSITQTLKYLAISESHLVGCSCVVTVGKAGIGGKLQGSARN